MSQYHLNKYLYIYSINYTECWIPGHIESRLAYQSGGLLNGYQAQANVEMIETCQSLCQQSPECYFFTYSEVSLNCYFHEKSFLKKMPGEQEYIYQDVNMQFFGPKYC